MKLFDRINKCVENINIDVYNETITSKFKSNQFAEWTEKITQIGYRGLNCVNDTTPNNASLTSLINLTKNFDNLALIDRFILQKSLFGNFFTFYIKSRIIVKIENKRIEYPHVIIPSEVGYYDEIFTLLWEQIIELYPDATYVPYILLINDINTDISRVNNIYDMLFGYEGDITKNKSINENSFQPTKK